MHIFERTGYILFFLVIVLVNLFRFYQLDSVPYGAQSDEVSCMTTVRCLAQEGTDAFLRPYPLFGTESTAPKPPTYIYPAAAWIKLFGSSIASFRAFMAVVFLLFFAGMFLLARKLYGNGYGVFVLAAVSISPWAWNFSRILYESPMAVFFVAWSLYAFFSAKSGWTFFLAGILSAGAMYAYPPLRLQIALSLIPVFIFRRYRFGLSLRHGVIFLAGVLLAAAPLIHLILRGELLGRFMELSITSKAYLASIGVAGTPADILGVFVRNFLTHFRPDYLFLSGDQNVVHATGRIGILSWLDMLGLAALLVLLFIGRGRKGQPGFMSKGDWAFAGGLLLMYMLAVVPAALTNEGLPHSLRSIGGLPFMILLTSFGLWKITRAIPFVGLLSGFVAAVFTIFLLQVYFFDYPQRTRGWFGAVSFEQAKSCKTDIDWFLFMEMYRRQDMTVQYFLMSERGYSCQQARKTLLDYGVLRKKLTQED